MEIQRAKNTRNKKTACVSTNGDFTEQSETILLGSRRVALDDVKGCIMKGADRAVEIDYGR